MRAYAAALGVIAMTSMAGAAVPEAQPTDTAYPNHRSYVYGSDAQPYTQYFYAESWWTSTDDYYVFEPRSGSQTVTSAPVVVYIHGWGTDGPQKVEAMIRHLTRSGMTVVYPTYLDWTTLANFDAWVTRTHTSIERALAGLARPGHVPVERDASGRPKLGFVAHSVGTYVATFLAEKAADEGRIPRPLVLAFTDPAGYDTKDTLRIDMSRIGDLDPQTDVVMLSAEDTLVTDQGELATHTQYAVRDFVTELPVTCDHLSAWVVASDEEGGTKLVSDHNGGPHSDQVFDAIDWWGYWPHISAHLKHAFWGTYASSVHDGSLFSGTWRDAAGGYLRDIDHKFAHPQYPQGYGCD